MKHRMIWLFTIVCLCQTAPSNGDTFEDRASFAVSLVEKKLLKPNCIHKARENANKFSLTGDKHFAVLWINMYSLDCVLDWKFNNFPFKLNKELRCRHFNQSDPEVLNLFLNISSVIDEALNFFEPQQYKQLFRGVKMEWPFVNRDLFVEEGFYSSSTDIDVALHFSDGQILLVIQELNGVNISSYVDDDYKNLKEVLGTSGKLFKIERKVINYEEISALMSNFKVSLRYNFKHPKMVLFMREINASQQVKDSVINEQKHLLEDICLTEQKMSILSMVVWVFVIMLVMIVSLVICILLMIICIAVCILVLIITFVVSIPVITVWLVSGMLNMIWWLAGSMLQSIVWFVGGTLGVIGFLIGGTLEKIGWFVGGLLELFEFSGQEWKQRIEKTDL